MAIAFPPKPSETRRAPRASGPPTSLEPPVASECAIHVGRQPILNRSLEIFGYELLSRQAGQDKAVITHPSKATYDVLSSIYTLFGADDALGKKTAFINFDEDLLKQDVVELFNPNALVLEILETAIPSPEFLESCKNLRSKGYHLCLDDFNYSEEWDPFLRLVEYVKLDYREHGPEGMATQLDRIRRFPVRRVAEKVETREEFETCKALRFDFFQGYFFCKPTTLRTRDISASQMTLIQLLNRSMMHASNDELEGIFKRDVGITYRLLCYINSAGMGLPCKITSIRHALALLGHRQLLRFLTLMLATSGERLCRATTQTAIARGRFLELLGRQSGLIGEKDFEKANQIFMVGMFSMLDVLLEMPMDIILQRLELHPAIEDALRDRKGTFGAYLQLAEAETNADAQGMDLLIQDLSLDPLSVSRLHFEAIAWTEQLTL